MDRGDGFGLAGEQGGDEAQGFNFLFYPLKIGFLLLQNLVDVSHNMPSLVGDFRRLARNGQVLAWFKSTLDFHFGGFPLAVLGGLPEILPQSDSTFSFQ